jgi:hypothetical protein
MAENITTDNIKYINAFDFGLPSASDLGMYWDTAVSALKKYYAGLNRGVTANAAVLSALNTDVITSLPNKDDFAIFASTAPNVPTANLWYISCIAGGSSVIGGRYMAFRTGGYVHFGYIATAGTITWIPLSLGTDNISTCRASSVMGLKGRNLQELGGYSTPQAAAAAIKALTSAGNFDQLRLGDYINFTNGLTVDGTNYPWSSEYENLKLRIIGFDHYYRIGGNIDVMTHHAVWDFANTIMQHRVNPTDTNTGGYAASEMYTFLSGVFATGITAMLGFAPIDINRLLSTHENWDWLTEKVFLPTVLEIFGAHGWDAHGGNTGYHGGSGVQYPFYALNPSARIKKYNGARSRYWLSDDRADITLDFTYVSHDGVSTSIPASEATVNVAPALCF